MKKILLCSGLVAVSLFGSSFVSGQAPAAAEKPQLTQVGDGYYVKFPRPTSFSGVTLPANMQGTYEVGLEMTPQEMVQPPSPLTDPATLAQLASYWTFRRQPQRAASIYQRAMAAAPNGSPLSMILANNYALLLSSAQGDHTAALNLLDQSLQTFPDNVPLLDSKGLVLVNSGNPVDALPVFERAVMLSCEGPIYVLHLANTLEQLGETARAKVWFDKARLPLDTLSPKMSPENRAMYDSLQMKYGP
ncbi:MAG: tetratricopeptide repeat protein [Thermoguttaceae bacterium]